MDIENKIHIYQENQLNESDEYNQPIDLYEVKRSLSLLRNNKSEDPDTIKNEFLKNGRSNCNFTKGLFLTNTTIRIYQLNRTHQL